MSRPQWRFDVRARLAALFGRERLDERADEELQFHLRSLQQRLTDLGASPEEARSRARRQLGNVTQLRERTLESWRYAWVDTVIRDVRYAVRALRRTPGFAATAILILAVAIGASTAMFSVFDALILHPLPYRDPAQLVEITESFEKLDVKGMQLAAVELDDLRAMTRSFSHLAGIRSGEFALTRGGAAAAVAGLQVSASVFPMLDVVPTLGQPFRAENEVYGQHRVAVLSERLWRDQFGADPNIVGTSVEINRESYRVAAVTRPILDYLGTAWDLWVPLSIAPGAKTLASRGAKGIDVIGRLEPGVTMAAAAQELAVVTSRLSAAHPGAYPANIGFSIDVAGLASTVAGDLRRPLLLLLAAVGVLMMIACANVSNLLMTRASARRKEIGVRVALGAGRLRVVGQLLTESLVIACFAGALGTSLAAVVLRLFTIHGPSDLVPVAGLGLNGWVVAFAIGVSSGASVFFGLVSAFATSAVLHDTLKASARGSTLGRRRFRASMVALQVAASLVLLVCAGLLIRSVLRLQQTDPGFDAGQVLTFELRLPESHYGESARRIALFEALRVRLQALPGVIAVGAADRIPFGRQGGSSLRVVGRPVDPGPEPMVRPSRVLPGYVESMGVPVRRGRSFTAADVAASGPVALIDEATALRFFPGDQDPIGRQITGVEPGLTATIVGVIGSVKRRDLSGAPEMSVYHAATQQAGPAMTFTVKTATEPLALVPAIRHQLAELDPLLPLTRVVTMEQRLADSVARQRLSMQLMVFFGFAALLLSATGLYGVLSYIVSQRRREVGIRVALGAQRRQVIELVVARQGLLPLAFGLVAGLASAFAVARLLAAGNHEIRANDPMVYVAVTLLLVVTALAAIAIPARRAATVDPVIALRQE